MPVTCQWTAPAAPCYLGARNWGRSPSAPGPVGRTCKHVRGAVARKKREPASAPKLSFPGPPPQPPASRAGPAQRPPSEEGRDSTHEGRRAGGSWEAELPGPGALSRSWRRPAALRPGPAARARPARLHAAHRPPGWPRFPARLPRAPRRSRSRTRPREQRARAPSLPAGPGARRPGPRCRHRALTRCLRRSATLLLGRRSPLRRPRGSEDCSARPSLSTPPPARAVSLQPP